MPEPFADITCHEDPCGDCFWCRFERPPQEAELPTDHLIGWLEDA